MIGLLKECNQKLAVYFINKYFYPDISATSKMLSGLLTVLPINDVHVITSKYYYNTDGELPSEQMRGDVNIHRIASIRSGQSIIRKILSFITFNISAMYFLLLKVKKNDMVVLKTDPPLMSVILLPVISFKSIRLVNWLQDVFPEVAIQLNYPLVKGLLGRLIIKARNYSLNKSYRNVVVSDDMMSYLVASGVNESKISVIHNWCVTNIKEIKLSKARKKFPENKKIIMYAGNLGRAHDYIELKNLVSAVGVQNKYIIVFCGGGVGYNYLRDFVGSGDVKNTYFLNYVPDEKLNDLLCAADIHLISLKPGFHKYLMPSKLYCVMKINKPILFVGDSKSMLAGILSKYGLGATQQKIQIDSIIGIIDSIVSGKVNNISSSEFGADKAAGQWGRILRDEKL